MSLNSAESKTSPHFWHSTNSASSSRATILTMGCLHLAVIGGGNCEWYGFCPSPASLSTGISLVFVVKFVDKLWWIRGGMAGKAWLHVQDSGRTLSRTGIV